MKQLMQLEDESRQSMGTILERNAEQYADHTAVLYEDVRFTHAEFNRAVNRYAHYFSSQGLTRGDVVTVLVDNRPELLMVIGALQDRCGLVADQSQSAW